MDKKKLALLIKEKLYEDALELISSMCVAEKPACSTPSDVFEFLKSERYARKEKFIVLTVDAQLKVIAKHIVSVGILDQTIVHAREVFRAAIMDNAKAIIIAHNHPSGNVNPSENDKTLTKKIKECGDILGISVLDHIIVSRKNYYSMNEMGVWV